MSFFIAFISYFILFLIGGWNIPSVERAPLPGETETQRAIETRNITLCLALPAQDVWVNPWDGDAATVEPKKECLEKYVRAIQDPKDCDVIEEHLSAYDRAECIEEMARVHSDPELCKQRRHAPNEWTGYPRCVAVATLDETPCFEIPERGKGALEIAIAHQLGECLVAVGREKKDYRVCEKINGPTFGYLDPKQLDAPVSPWEWKHDLCLSSVAACPTNQRATQIEQKELCSLIKDEETR